MTTAPEAFFLPSDGNRMGQRFCLFHPAHGDAPLGLVMYVHPFAEEMNKSRRMAALQSRALAQAGYAVLQVDLLGCGDSSGDFGDATWQAWVADVVHGCQWLRERTNPQRGLAEGAPLWLWGLRAGCLLAVEAAERLDEPCNFLFWQPPSAGKQLLQQFLRLKVAGDMLGGQAKGAMDGLRQQLASGASVEITGYMLSAGLASGLEQATLSPPPVRSGMQAAAVQTPPSGTNLDHEADQSATVNMGQECAVVPPATAKGPAQRLEWLEVSAREDASLNPVSTKTIGEWQQAGFNTRSHIINGPAFWQTTEIEDAPALLVATVSAVSRLSLAQEAVAA